MHFLRNERSADLSGADEPLRFPPPFPAEEPAEPARPGIDLPRLKEKFDLPDDLQTEVFSLFLETHSAFASKLGRELAENKAAARKLVHSMRGLAGHVGAFRLAELAGLMEDALVSDDAAASERLFGELEREFSFVLGAVKALAGGATPPAPSSPK